MFQATLLHRAVPTHQFRQPRGICVINTSFSGNIQQCRLVNPSSGLLSPTGIQIKHSTINGVIANSGTISGGISIDGTSRVCALDRRRR